jgi:hypothetical protein
LAATLRQLDRGRPGARVDGQADVPPAHGLLGFDEFIERHATEIHPGISSDAHESAPVAFDHLRGHLLRIGRKHDVDVGLAAGLAGLEPDIERQARNAIGDVLRGAGLEVVDADADLAMPARETAPRRRCDDLADEVSDVDAKVVLDVAHPLAADDDFFYSCGRFGCRGRARNRLLRRRVRAR